ncbi:hypothetical protein CEXT_374281 [Caerostris extrusa]|uniref:Cytochrome c oxidase subunit 1 n=1 Tax=Caerostris extrusa TaxID=172846 RepID=A0AAV4NGD6_CAEEX|nr:hypothetical protein CEXT_374281 [Caerostris extrusa]
MVRVGIIITHHGIIMAYSGIIVTFMFSVYLYGTLRYRPEAYEHNRTTHSSSPSNTHAHTSLLSNPNPANNFRDFTKLTQTANNGPRTPDGLRKASHPEDSKGHCSNI